MSKICDSSNKQSPSSSLFWAQRSKEKDYSKSRELSRASITPPTSQLFENTPPRGFIRRVAGNLLPLLLPAKSFFPAELPVVVLFEESRARSCLRISSLNLALNQPRLEKNLRRVASLATLRIIFLALKTESIEPCFTRKLRAEKLFGASSAPVLTQLNGATS